MRYGNNENTNILSSFDTGLTITIDIYDLSDDSLIVNNGACSEVGTTGIYKYTFSNSNTIKSEFLWIMKSDLDNHSGKIVLGGILDTIQAETDKITSGIINSKDDYKATTTISSNMRGTDNANIVIPNNTAILESRDWAKKAGSQRFI